ncbi:Isochorismatase-like protein [Gymnopilus junonius]|uniref:Isochorismatase-like protein n=1 Tax=Gymnopilus junonius TaxID=109634 RepID=A0A9P5NHW1_GYMJU|nr:Isochorismatase-like protein [Gymnopilus junonius]
MSTTETGPSSSTSSSSSNVPPNDVHRVLLLLDIQVAMLSPPPVGVPASRTVQSNLNHILAYARAANPPPLIVHVRNNGDVGDPDEPLAAGWQLIFPALPGEIIIDKRKNNAFAGTELGSIIPTHAEIVVAGFQTDYSIRATCSAALGRGNEVLLIKGAHATYDRIEVLHGGGITPAWRIEQDIEAELEEAGVHLLEMKDLPGIFEDRHQRSAVLPPPRLQPSYLGELRFRICDTPAEFEGGQDLLRRDGDLPWSIRLCSFAMVDKYQGAVHLLRQDGMVDEGVLDDLAELPPIPRTIRNVLCEIGQPFEVNLASALIPLVVVDRYGWQMFEMRNMFRDNRDRMRKHPYTGKALIRLVVSPLPEHGEDPALFIQFVKWLTPVECIIPEYDYHVARPVPNTYYRLKDKKGVYKRWSYALKPKWNADNLRRMLDLEI